MAPISQASIAAINAFVQEHHIPHITLQKGQRKDDIAAEHLAHFLQEEGVLFVGKAQEKIATFRTEKRRNPETGRTYPWIVRSTAPVNQYYFYCVDRDFGPFCLKFSSYFPYNAKIGETLRVSPIGAADGDPPASLRLADARLRCARLIRRAVVSEWSRVRQTSVGAGGYHLCSTFRQRWPRLFTCDAWPERWRTNNNPDSFFGRLRTRQR